MKRLVRFKLNFETKWLTFSGVMMGFAFFLQALDYFALRHLPSIDIGELILFLVLPMVLEACWCVPLRGEIWKKAEIHGIFAAIFCVVLLAQTVVTAGLFSIILSSVFFIMAGAAAVLIAFGFIPYHVLGMLIFAAVGIVRILLFTIPVYFSSGPMSLIQELPPVCMIIGLLLFFGGIRQDQISTEE